jgi:hypothetical protein
VKKRGKNETTGREKKREREERVSDKKKGRNRRGNTEVIGMEEEGLKK